MVGQAFLQIQLWEEPGSEFEYNRTADDGFQVLLFDPMEIWHVVELKPASYMTY